MNAPVAAPRAKATSPFAAMVAYTLRSCFPKKRRLGLLIPCAIAVLFGLLSHRAEEVSQAAAFARIGAVPLCGLVLPIACLVIGDAVLGAEVRSGTLQFTWLSPVPFWQIVVARWVAGTVVAWVSVVPAFALAALVAGVPEDAAALALAAAAGSMAYVALFILIGAVTRRSAVWALVVVFLGERLLGNALTFVAQLSPGWLARFTFVGMIDVVPKRVTRSGVVDGGTAVAYLVVLAAAWLAIAAWRLRSAKLSGAAD